MTVVRQLRAGEESAFLELLDGWPFSDGRRGREFFRKYVDDDHRYAPENVWVAEEDGQLVSCAQIFPRQLYPREWSEADRAVLAGGIGSVFTASSHRRQGLAEQVLEACTLDMRQRGMSLSLLSGTRARWYSSLGWRPWPSQSHRLRWTGDAPPEPQRLQSSDLEDVAALHAEYSSGRPGCVARTQQDWATSRRVAGNPDESFSLARRDGRLVAYLRTAALGGRLVTEWGRSPDGAESLSQLLAHEAHRTPERELNAPRLADDELEAELEASGFHVETACDPPAFDRDPKRPVWMLKPLGAGDWQATSHEELTDRLPPSDFCFWPSDRF